MLFFLSRAKFAASPHVFKPPSHVNQLVHLFLLRNHLRHADLSRRLSIIEAIPVVLPLRKAPVVARVERTLVHNDTEEGVEEVAAGTPREGEESVSGHASSKAELVHLLDS